MAESTTKRASSGIIGPMTEGAAAVAMTFKRERTRVRDPQKNDAIAIVPRDRPVPLSSAQKRVLEHQPNTARWNLHIARRWRGPLDVAALEEALVELTSRHEALRTTLSLEETQIVAPAVARPLSIVDVSQSESPADEAAARASVEVEEPLDPHRGPVFRATLFRLRTDDHVLLIIVHHAMSDGLSLEVIEDELVRIYDAFRRGRPSPLVPHRLQYADYTIWHRQWIEGARAERQLTFWKAQLEGAPNLTLPTDRPRPARQTFSGAIHEFVVPRPLTAAIHALSRRERVTPFMTLQGALSALLARYSGENDISIGTSVANRPRVELEAVVGFFVNTLILRNDLGGAPDTHELLRRVRTTALAAYANQDVPFDRVVEALGLAHDPSRAPLAQVMFSTVGSGRCPTIDGLTFELFKIGSTATHHDLSLFVEEQDGLFCATVEYNVDLFEAATVERFAGHLLHLLEGMTARPDVPVCRLPILMPTEERSLVDFNTRVRAAPPSPQLVHEVFAAQAARNPTAVAVSDGSSSLSYAELDERSTALAEVLVARRIGRGDVVALLVPRSVLAVVGILGTLKAGAAYLPIERDLPAARVHRLLEDSGARAVLVDDDETSGFAATVISLRELKGASSTVRSLLPAVSMRDAAYVLYTSGSTGKPKGVVVDHDQLAAYLRGATEDFALPAGSYALVSTLSADLGLTAIFPPLMLGGTLHVLNDEVRHSPALFQRFIAENAIDVLKIVPSHFLALTEGRTGFPRQRLILGGEALLPKDVRLQLEARPQGCRIINEYGPTETTVGVVACDVDGITDESRATVPIGRPMPGCSAYVLDSECQLQPIGVYGELFIGGDQIARGYRNEPAKTAERFLPNPFISAPGARMYRTGDLARWRSDGTLECAGRSDDQIKLRGFRVELGEIEVALSRCAGVGAAVVLAREDVPGNKRLVGYVVAAAGATLDLLAIEEALAATLPDYMIPSAIVVLGSLPLTSNGKVDRRALPAPTPRPDSEASGTSSDDALERTVARVFAEVLGVPSVGLDDAFTALGGSSLTAVRVLGRIHAELQFALPFTALFDFASVRRLAAELRRQGVAEPASGARAPTTAIPRRRARDGEVMVSFDQFPYWFTEQLMPGINIAAMRLSMPRGRRLNVTALQRAFDAVIFRNEILRTTYRLAKGKPVQLIEPAGRSQPIGFTDLRALDRAAQNEELARVESSVKNDRFDLKRGPVLRLHAVALEDDEHILLACGHHAAWDAHSSVNFGHELSVFYETFERGGPITLPPLKVQYADYCHHQRAQHAAGECSAALDYWADRLRGGRPLGLPIKQPRRARGSHAASRVAWSLDVPTSSALRSLAAEKQSTIFSVIASSVALAIGRCSRATDVVFGTTVSTRNRVEIDSLLGCFVNTLPLRVDVDTNDLTELLGRTQVATTEALSNNVPFDLIVERVGRTQEAGRQPIYDVLLAAQSDATQPESDVFQVHRIEAESTAIDRDLQFQIEHLAESIHGWTQYRTELYDESTVQAITDDLVVILRAMADRRMPPPRTT